MRITLFLIFGLGICFSSCDESRIFEQNIDFDNRLWIADSTVTFEFEIPTSSSQYNLYYNIRNTVSYPYHNLYIKYILEDTLGNSYKEELISQDLFNPKTGLPYGEGLGDIYSHQFPLLKDFQFSHSGVYRIKLQQFMRKDSLEGIISTGVRVEHAVKDE